MARDFGGLDYIISKGPFQLKPPCSGIDVIKLLRMLTKWEKYPNTSALINSSFQA